VRRAQKTSETKTTLHPRGNAKQQNQTQKALSGGVSNLSFGALSGEEEGGGRLFSCPTATYQLRPPPQTLPLPQTLINPKTKP
jgi:hypothetical protein